MNNIPIIILLLLIIVVTVLLIDLKKTATYFGIKRSQSNGTIYIVVSLMVIILFFPMLFIQLYKNFNLQSTGSIGDTINGIAGPFISAIGSILVYIAFKEQVKSSEKGREERKFDIIISSINKLDEDPYKISPLSTACLTDINQGQFDTMNMIKLTRILAEFQHLLGEIEEQNEGRKHLENRIFLSWKSIYEPHISPVNQILIPIGVINSLRVLISESGTFHIAFNGIERKMNEF